MGPRAKFTVKTAPTFRPYYSCCGHKSADYVRVCASVCSKKLVRYSLEKLRCSGTAETKKRNRKKKVGDIIITVTYT